MQIDAMPACLFAKAVAIDLDGTLIDTETEIWTAVNSTLQRFGRVGVSVQQLLQFTGSGAHAMLSAALRAGSDRPDLAPAADVLQAALTSFKADYRRVLGTQSRLFAGVHEGLRLLRHKGLPLVCVTNKGRDEALQLLTQFGLMACFEQLEAPLEARQRKPAPFLLHSAQRLLRLQPQELLLIGDTDNDVLAARAAGSQVIRVATGYDRFKAHKAPADLDCPGFFDAALAIQPWPNPG